MDTVGGSNVRSTAGSSSPVGKIKTGPFGPVPVSSSTSIPACRVQILREASILTALISTGLSHCFALLSGGAD
jgi:hypothetical protein